VRRALTVAGLVLLPTAAEACATCIATPYGDRTYSWPYLFLILLPFVVATVIAGVLARANGVGLATVRDFLARLVHPAVRHKETT
jgi:hypothetical protein